MTTLPDRIANINSLVDKARAEDEYGAPSPELVIAHTNLYWDDQSAPGRRGGTVPTAKVEFT